MLEAMINVVISTTNVDPSVGLWNIYTKIQGVGVAAIAIAIVVGAINALFFKNERLKEFMVYVVIIGIVMFMAKPIAQYLKTQFG